MKQFILFICKITGLYDKIYYKGYRDAGLRMHGHAIWWNQTNNEHRWILQNAFEIYSDSLLKCYCPDMMRIRKEVDEIGNKPNPYPETPTDVENIYLSELDNI